MLSMSRKMLPSAPPSPQMILVSMNLKDHLKYSSTSSPGSCSASVKQGKYRKSMMIQVKTMQRVSRTKGTPIFSVSKKCFEPFF